MNTPNKFQEGSIVYAVIAPNVALVIRRYVDRIYYCTVRDFPELNEQVYFERELSAKVA